MLGFKIGFWDYATFLALISIRAYTWFSWLYPMPF